MKFSNVISILKSVLILAFVVAMCFSFAACDLDQKPQKETYVTASPKPSSEPVKDTFAINETAVFKDLKITALETKESEGESFYEADDGKVFLGVKFEVENISSEDQTISSLLMFDAYVDDVSYDMCWYTSSVFGTGIDGTIAPGKKLVGWFSVEAPIDWSTYEIFFTADMFSNSKATFVFEK